MYSARTKKLLGREKASGPANKIIGAVTSDRFKECNLTTTATFPRLNGDRSYPQYHACGNGQAVFHCRGNRLTRLNFFTPTNESRLALLW